MLKRLMILAATVAMMLVVAAPAIAQTDETDPNDYQHSGTGVLGEPYTVSQDPTLYYPLTDEETGTVYELMSGFVELGDLVGMSIYFEGQQVPGLEPGPNDPIPVNVTSAESETGYDPAPLAVITGEIQPAPDTSGGATHIVTEASTGAGYGLFSDTVDLSQYEGQSVAVYGSFQAQGAPISDFEDPTEVLIAVTSVESLEPLPVEPPAEDQYGDEGTVTNDATEDEVAEDEASGDGVVSVLPDTGGFSMLTLGIFATLMLGGGGLLAYGLIRH